jgi:hypothetical protein
MEPSTFYPLLVFSIVVSIGAVVLAYLWQTEKTAAENAEKAAEHFEKRGNIIIGELNDAERKLTEARIELLDSKATNKTLTETNAHLSDILSRAYVRNRYGILQAYQHWAVNGDKKPKPRKPSETSKPKRNG